MALPGPFYLNNVLVTPNIIKNLLSIRRFTTNNCCLWSLTHLAFM
jgi:hypothetical protein